MKKAVSFKGQDALNKIMNNKNNGKVCSLKTGTSIFDPVLCELIYRWFCPQNGTVLDPFAGGSVRGIVASKLGRSYIGVDLREEQVSTNIRQAEIICSDPIPRWIIGDSEKITEYCCGVQADLIFSCPPYVDLEVYSDHKDDLSTMNYDDFISKYSSIINSACSLLKDDRFACFVVGDVRDKKGFYYGFPLKTVECFKNAGLELYNEAVLITAVGTLPIRAGKIFQQSRKLGKTHQNVLIFCKGDPKRATESIGDVDCADVFED